MSGVGHEHAFSVPLNRVWYTAMSRHLSSKIGYTRFPTDAVADMNWQGRYWNERELK